jgi:hypothetical protein
MRRAFSAAASGESPSCRATRRVTMAKATPHPSTMLPPAMSASSGTGALRPPPLPPPPPPPPNTGLAVAHSPSALPRTFISFPAG